MMKLSEKKVRVVDNGLFIGLAQRLAEDFKEVEYYVRGKKDYPCIRENLIGKGVSGITRIDSMWDDWESVDLWCFFDVGDGDVQEKLRKLGKRVFGTGRSERMEQDRLWFMGQMGKLGLPVPRFEAVTGMDNLVALLKAVKNKWVKVSEFRGDCETFHHKTYMKSMSQLDLLAHNLGGYRNHMQFLVFDDIPGCEPGWEWYMCQGDYTPIGTLGYEDKGKGYVGKVLPIDQMPAPIVAWNEKIAKLQISFGINGMLSHECRMDERDNLLYGIDPCMRGGSPVSEMLAKRDKNFGEIVWKIGGGEMVTADPIKQYSAEIIVKSTLLTSCWTPINFPESYKDKLIFRNICVLDGQMQCISGPGSMTIGAAIGFGDTKEEAEAEALDAAQHLDAPEVFYDDRTFETLDEELDKAEFLGLGAF